MSPHRSLFSQYPLVQLATAFSCGICAAAYWPARLMCVLVAGAVCSIVSLLWRKRTRRAGVALLLAFFFAGETLALLEARNESRRTIRDLADDGSVTLTGVLDGPPEFARDRLYLSLSVSETNVSGRVWLLAPFRNAAIEQDYRALQLRYGARVRITTTLERTGDYRNPGVSSLAEYLDRRDYDASGLIKSPSSIARLDDARVFAPLAWLYDWRERLQREIDSRFPPETAGVLDAALLGNRYSLSHDASDRFREGGTFHVLVISGFHISFIGGIVFLCVRRLTRRRSVQFVLPSLVVWSYSLAVGAEASVVRAALMFTFAGLAAILFRKATSLNALGGAALLLLVCSPKQIFDPSFQLTFLSVLAIIVIAWPLLLRFAAIGSWHPTRSTPFPPNCSRALKTFCELLFWSEQKWKRELARTSHKYRLFKPSSAVWLERCYLQHCLRYVFGAIVVSASVQLVLLPQMIVYFHRLSLASLLLNIVVSFLLTALIFVAILALLVSQASTLASAPLIKLTNGINWLMVHSVDPFSSFKLATMRLPEYSGRGVLIYVAYYLPLLLLVFALSHWRPLAAPSAERCRLHRFVLPLSFAQTLLLAIVVLHPLSSGRADGRLRVDFLDVGQGDSALVTMPNGMTLLVDGGGRPSFPSANTTETTRSIGETVVSEYLWWRGLSRVDYVLVTHADADHIDGLNDVLRNFTVGTALVARSPANDPEFAKFSATLRETKTHVETMEAGDTIHLGDVEVDVLWPRAGGETSANNDSIVLRVQFGERSVLLTGDIEKAAEQEILTSSPRLLHVDVVKTPHHGSRTSSTQAFVLATRPEYAIISVGRHSMFGHPHKEVVDRWQANGATVLTTGNCGTITVTTDGKDLTLDHFVPYCGGKLKPYF
jgi:competence protein ComEC